VKKLKGAYENRWEKYNYENRWEKYNEKRFKESKEFVSILD